MEKVVCGNLFEEFETPSKTEKKDNGATKQQQTLDVFLRVRPYLEEEKEDEKLSSCFQIDDEDKKLTSMAPKHSFNFKSAHRGCSELQHKFTFTKIFGPHIGQKDMFQATVLNSVKESLNGKNALIFTYGVTNSGKTYTINGSSKDTGILPRTVDVIFNSIGNRSYSSVVVKPLNYDDFTILDEREQQLEAACKKEVLDVFGSHDHKQSQLTISSIVSSECSISDTSKISSDQTITSATSSNLQHEDSCVLCALDREIDQRFIEDAIIEIDNRDQYKYAVWVSYAEVYNEQIFDLLVTPVKKKKERRHVLRQKQDQNGHVYVKGLREVLVNSHQEAYKIFKIGQRNQQVAATKLNQQSSRSHCIFNIKILQIIDGPEPEVANISQLCFVDLAGSERQTKTHALGIHMGEAGKINNSLMTLGKCIEAMRYNQYHRTHPRIVPFRESQLTRWLQNHFAGHGSISMIVNISPCTQAYDETLHVLRFSAIAKQVTTVARQEAPAPYLPLLPRVSIAWENDENISIEREDEGREADHRINGLLELIELLKDALIEKDKELRSVEEKVRKEVTSELRQHIEERQADWQEYTQHMLMLREEKYEEKIEALKETCKKRKRSDSDSESDEEQRYKKDTSTTLLESLVEKPADAEVEQMEITTPYQAQIDELQKINEALREKLNKANANQERILELEILNEELRNMATEREIKLRGLQLEKKDVQSQTTPDKTRAMEPQDKQDTPCQVSFQESPAKHGKESMVMKDLEDALQDKIELVQFLEFELASFKKTAEEAEAAIAKKNEELIKLKQDQLDNVQTEEKLTIDPISELKDENHKLMRTVAEYTRQCEAQKMEIESMKKNEQSFEDNLNGKNKLIESFREQLQHACQESGKQQEELVRSQGSIISLEQQLAQLTSDRDSTKRKLQFYEEEMKNYEKILNATSRPNKDVRTDVKASQTEGNDQKQEAFTAVIDTLMDKSIQCTIECENCTKKLQDLNNKNALLTETIAKRSGELIISQEMSKEVLAKYEELQTKEKLFDDTVSDSTNLRNQIDNLQQQLRQIEESEQRKSEKLMLLEKEMKAAKNALIECKSDFVESLERAESDCNKVNNENLELENINKNLQKQISDQERRIENLQEELSKLRSAEIETNKQLSTLQTEITEKIRELNVAKDNYAVCMEQLEISNMEWKEVTLNLDDARIDNSTKGERIQDLTMQLTEANTTLQEKIELVHHKDIEIQDIKSKLMLAVANLGSSSEDSVVARQRIDSLTNENELLKQQIEKMNRQLVDLDDKDIRLSSAMANLQNVAAGADKAGEQVNHLTKENEDLKRQVDQLQFSITQMEENDSKLCCTISKLESEKDATSKLVEKIDQLTKENDELRKQVQLTQDSIASITKERDELMKLANRMTTTESTAAITSAKEEIDQLTKTNNELRMQMQTVQDDEVLKTEVMNKATKENNELRNQLQILQDNIAVITKERDEVFALTSAVTGLENTYFSTDDLGGAKVAISKIKDHNNEIAKENVELKNQLRLARDQLVVISAENAKPTEDASIMVDLENSAAVAKDNERIDQLKKEKDEMLQQLQLMQNNLTVLTEERDQLAETIDNYQKVATETSQDKQQIDLAIETEVLRKETMEFESKVLNVVETTDYEEISSMSMEKIVKELQEIRTEFAELKLEHKDLLSRHKLAISLAKDKEYKLETTRSEEIGQRQRLRNQLGELRRELDKLTEDLDTEVDKTRAAEKKVATLQDEMLQLEKEKDNLIKRLNTKNDDIETLVSNKADNCIQYVSQVTQLKESKEKLEVMLKNVEADRIKLLEDVKDMSEKKSTLIKKQKNLESTISDSEIRIKELLDENSTLLNTNIELTESKQKLECCIKELENSASSNKEKMDELQMNYLNVQNKFNADLHTAQEQIEQSEGQAESEKVVTDEHDLDKQPDVQNQEIKQGLGIKLISRRYKLNQQPTEYERELERQLQAAEKAKKDIEEKYSSTVKELDAISNEKTNLENLNEILKREIEQLNQDIEDANQAIDDAKDSESKLAEWRQKKDEIAAQFRATLQKIVEEKDVLEQEKQKLSDDVTEITRDAEASKQQVNELLQTKEQLGEEVDQLRYALESIKMKADSVASPKVHQVTPVSDQKKATQEDETLVRASTPQFPTAESVDAVHTPKASEVIPKTAGLSSITSQAESSIRDPSTSADADKASTVKQATRKRTRRKRVVSDDEASVENVSPNKSLKIDNEPGTPQPTRRGMRSAKAKAIASLAEAENVSPVRPPLSSKEGDNNASTSKKSSTGKRFQKVVNNLLQGSPILRSSKKKSKEKNGDTESSTKPRLPPTKPKRKLHNVQDMNEYSTMKDIPQQRETNKAKEVVTRQLRPRRR